MEIFVTNGDHVVKLMKFSIEEAITRQVKALRWYPLVVFPWIASMETVASLIVFGNLYNYCQILLLNLNMIHVLDLIFQQI